MEGNAATHTHTTGFQLNFCLLCTLKELSKWPLSFLGPCTRCSRAPVLGYPLSAEHGQDAWQSVTRKIWLRCGNQFSEQRRVKVVQENVSLEAVEAAVKTAVEKGRRQVGATSLVNHQYAYTKFHDKTRGIRRRIRFCVLQYEAIAELMSFEGLVQPRKGKQGLHFLLRVAFTCVRDPHARRLTLPGGGWKNIRKTKTGDFIVVTGPMLISWVSVTQPSGGAMSTVTVDYSTTVGSRTATRLRFNPGHPRAVEDAANMDKEEYPLLPTHIDAVKYNRCRIGRQFLLKFSTQQAGAGQQAEAGAGFITQAMANGAKLWIENQPSLRHLTLDIYRSRSRSKVEVGVEVEGRGRGRTRDTRTRNRIYTFCRMTKQPVRVRVLV